MPCGYIIFNSKRGIANVPRLSSNNPACKRVRYTFTIIMYGFVFIAGIISITVENK